MTDAFVYRPEGSPDIIERQRLNQAGGGGGSGGGSGSSAGSGGGGQSSGSNESREQPSYTGRGDSRNNNAQERTGQGDPGIPQSQGAQPFQRQHLFGQPSNHTSQGEQPKEQNHMTYCPPAFGFSAASPYGLGLPYAAPYGAFPAAAAPAGANVVVAGDHGHDKHDALLGITVDNIRESSSVGRSAQLGTQISHIGDHIDTLADRADARASAERDLMLQKEFSHIHSRFGDMENRLLTEFKNSEINRLQEDKGLLREQVADSREARRFDDLRDSIRDLTRLMADRLPK